jgi:putative transposase
MERKIPFIENEVFHLYSRGVEKRDIFTCENDYRRFQVLLGLCNTNERVKFSNKARTERGEPSLGSKHSRETLTDVIAYALMPNHIHLIVREKQAGGISKFMLKLMTAYSMYFNTKYERSGPLFTRPFRSKHIDSDEYFLWAFAYTLLNPLELFQPDWKTTGVSEKDSAARFMQSYRWGSFRDYFGNARPESCILEKNAAPLGAADLKNFDALLSELSRDPESYQEKSFERADVASALV